MSEDKRKNLRDLLDEMDRYFEEFEKDVQEVVRSSVFGGRSASKPFIAGFSFSLGSEGKPSVQIFGDSSLRNDGYRSPIVDQILDEKNGVLKLILEMPGVEKQDIKVDATEGKAVITAVRQERKYRAEVSLDSEVRPDSGKAEYKNGMLEISFYLKDKANKGFRRVDVV
jgi:HSP20 family protein